MGCAGEGGGGERGERWTDQCRRSLRFSVPALPSPFTTPPPTHSAPALPPPFTTPSSVPALPPPFTPPPSPNRCWVRVSETTFARVRVPKNHWSSSISVLILEEKVERGWIGGGGRRWREEVEVGGGEEVKGGGEGRRWREEVEVLGGGGGGGRRLREEVDGEGGGKRWREEEMEGVGGGR